MRAAVCLHRQIRPDDCRADDAKGTGHLISGPFPSFRTYLAVVRRQCTLTAIPRRNHLSRSGYMIVLYPHRDLAAGTHPEDMTALPWKTTRVMLNETIVFPYVL